MILNQTSSTGATRKRMVRRWQKRYSVKEGLEKTLAQWQIGLDYYVNQKDPWQSYPLSAAADIRWNFWAHGHWIDEETVAINCGAIYLL